MALDSQVGKVGSISGNDYTGLLHEVYAGKVKPAIRATSPTLQLFQDLGPGEYRIDGEKLVGSTDLRYSGQAMHTTGYLPDHIEHDAVEWQITPVRAYRRGAIDNFVQARGGAGPGSFGDVLTRLFDQCFDAFKRMKIRNAVGGSSGVVCVTSSRTSATVVVMKDGYNHVGTSPLMHLQPAMIMAWLDATNAYAVGGSGTISSIAPTTDTVTFTASIENGSGTPTIAAGDLWVFATTTLYSTDYFGTEYNVARQGLLNIVDPDANDTTTLNISTSTYPAWSPYRVASSTFDHIEITEFADQLAAQSTEPVTPQSHVALTSGAVRAELARTLEGHQQQMNLGRQFEGGYRAVNIGGQDIVADPYQLHDVLYLLCLDNLYNVDIGGPEDFYDEDGSMFSRLAGFDGKEWYLAEYGNTVYDRRNRHGALTGIAISNVTADLFTPVSGVA